MPVRAAGGGPAGALFRAGGGGGFSVLGGREMRGVWIFGWAIIVGSAQVGKWAGDAPLDFLSDVAGQGGPPLLFPGLIMFARVPKYGGRPNFALGLGVVQPAGWLALLS
eukprot:gene546-biopygen459